MSSTSKQPKEEHNNKKKWNINGTTEISVALYRLYSEMKRCDEGQITKENNNSNLKNIHSTKFSMKKAGPALSSTLKVSMSIFPWRKAIIAKPCITNKEGNHLRDYTLMTYLFIINHYLRSLTWNINSRKIHKRWKLRYKCRKVRCSTKLVFPVCK